MNFKKENRYYVKIPKDFLKDFGLKKDDLLDAIKNYIHTFYLHNKAKTFKAQLKSGEKVIFHKIQVKDNNKSSKKAKRVLLFILLNNPSGINTIFPVFAFSTQEEKKYTTDYLKTDEFVRFIIRKFKKYQDFIDITGEKISETLGTKI